MAASVVALATAVALPAAAVALPAWPPADATGAGRASVAGGARVVISELSNAGTGSRSDSFFELENAGDETVDLSGWRVHRCSMQGLRANTGRVEADLYGVVLAPGERFVAARAGTDLGGVAPDAVFTQAFADTGFGLVLTDAAGATADSVGVYPNLPWPTTSECTVGGNLPNALAAALGESWQRVAETGDPSVDFVRAPATPGAPNVAEAQRSTARVEVAEVAASGPDGGRDELVELRNTGQESVDLAGWRLLVCGPSGRAPADEPGVRLDGVELDAGERAVIAGDEAQVDDGVAVLRADLGLAAHGFGVLLVDAADRRVDGVAASAYGDSACQSGDAKLTTAVDGRTGESWQRTGPGGDDADWVVASRTPGAANARREDGLRDRAFAYDAEPGVAISELATDPGGMPAGVERRNYVELANYGDASVDLGGWRVLRCTQAGPRYLGDALVIPDGTRLEPGGTWLAALEGTPAADRADAVLAEAFDFRGTGAWVERPDGSRVDSVGVYLANEMDFSVERPSPCTKGMSLTTFAPDRLAGETYQRVGFSGTDADDFAVARATPGDGGLVPSIDPIAAAMTRAADELERAIAAESRGEQRRATLASTPRGTATAPLAPATVLRASTGSSDGPLTVLDGPDARALDAGAPAVAADDGTRLPYLRLGVALPGAMSAVAWRGEATPRTALRLSVWRPADAAWRTLDERVAGDDGAVELAGAVRDDERMPQPDGSSTAELLVQTVPRATTLARGSDGAFDAASDYDLALSHLTDTQYLAEAYPETYAEVVSWIAANARHRDIAFATHTGDLVQNWVDPDQHEALARREFDVASRMQAVLDDAGVPNSVLPGNHDNKRGITNDLFNEYFGPDRYDDEPWYGGSIAPGDNSANFSLFEHAGAPFLMLSLPYAYGEREIAWAERVIARHPERNVVISTHEHLTPKLRDEPARRSVSSRWVSRGGELWERVVAPNANVVLVLSGHFHGVGSIVTEDAGGIPGHTVVELLADYQEFRTHDGARATGFQRLLQLDLAGGAIAVDTFSVGLDATASHPYDYVQFDPERGDAEGASEMRPWNILERGVQHRYTAADDAFLVEGIAFRYEKRIASTGVYATAG